MKLASLHIDRFGARSGLDLSDISDQLNVIYGPNGSGKTTLIQFVRWMIFGQCDEISRRYLTTSGPPAKGSISIRDGVGIRTLHRASQSGSLFSQLTADGGTQSTAGAPIAISNSEFDRFYLVSFDQPRSVDDLLNSARSHGLQLHVDQRQIDRIRQLTEQLDRHRGELSRFSQYGPVEVLRSRREEHRGELESIRLQWQRRRDELERTRHQLGSEVSEQQMLTDRLRSVVSNIDLAIDGRKRQLAEEHQQWAETQRETDQRRHSRIQELDSQANRWQEILNEVRARLEQVRNRITSLGDVSFSATEASDLHFFMRKLGFRIRDVEQDLSGVYDTETWRDHEADVEYLRGLLNSALKAMQSDITHLGQTVERQRQVNELHEWREELTYLCRVEKELAELTDAISRQRHQLARESEFSPRFSPADVTDPHNTSPQELATLLDDFRLRHLIERRESAAARLNEAELELANRKRQLRDVEAELDRSGQDSRSEILEREIVDLDEQLRMLEQRDQLERTIASLEDELRRTRENSGRSEISDQAAAILQGLTNNEYRSLRISGGQDCQVSRTGRWDDSQSYDYSQLSRGVQDQVYLALSLAIVSAYRRKGIVTPLILNDVFVNLDQTSTRALARVLKEFSARDHQVFVFTRHEHIRELFSDTDAKHFTLTDLEARRYEPAPPMAPAVFTTAVEESPMPAVMPTPLADLSPSPEDPTYQWVAEWQRRDPLHVVPKHTPTPPPVEKPEEDPPPTATTLRLESPLSDATTLSDDFVDCLAELGIRSVHEFVELDPDSLEEQLGDHGVTGEMVQRRQRELLMIVYLGVSVLDAQLLVACGVPDPDRLSRADDAVLLKRIETILERPQAAQRFGARSKYSLARIRRWIELAERSEYRSRSRRSNSPDNTSQRSSIRSTNRRKTNSSNGSATRSNGSGNRKSTRSSDRSTVKMTPKSKPKPLRFYLEVNDPVVDAPSIGPKTAEKLNEIDVHTIANLVDADPEQIADQLNDRRISGDDIAQWQLQAQLVCRIPNLRGHDAQILVACGVEDPVTLSSMDASSFLKQVTKFVNTKDGQRVVRSGKKPDLAEVTAWIEWSESARQLRAA